MTTFTHPLRFERTTTGKVHAARFVTMPANEYRGEVDLLILACGWEPNTAGSVIRAAVVEVPAETPLTCARCVKKVAAE